MEPAEDVPASSSARASATVILARDGEDGRGLEVFLLRRHGAARYAPNVYVFPGGTVRADDLAPFAPHWPTAERLRLDLAARYYGAEPPEDVGALYLTAIRETFEEAGVLLAHAAAGPDGEPLAVDALPAERQAELDQARYHLQADQGTLADVLANFQVSPSFASVVPFSHWVTPAGRPMRFDTWFFVARMPDHQAALHCNVETTDGQWLSPLDALNGAEQGTYDIIFPTLRHLARVAACHTVSELLAYARRKRIYRVQPLSVPGQRDPLIPSDVPEEW